MPYISATAVFFLVPRQPRLSTLFPYTTLFRSGRSPPASGRRRWRSPTSMRTAEATWCSRIRSPTRSRSEEHTSELQSHSDLVCRLLLEKKNGRPVFELAMYQQFER